MPPVNIYETLRAMQALVQQDEGQRGIAPLCKAVDNGYTDPLSSPLRDAAIALVQAQKVVIVTGYACNFGHDPMTETDGLGGARALALVLLHHEVQVVVVSDTVNEVGVRACMSGLSSIELVFIDPVHCTIDNLRELVQGVHVVLSIERSGRTAQQRFLTMGKGDMTEFTAPLDALFLQPLIDEGYTTIAIGDGGNEIGMGNVVELVRQHIKNGPDIACIIPSHVLLVCSVSDWGGYALAFATALVGTGYDACREHLPSPDSETRLHNDLASLGIRDGVTHDTGWTLDGLDFEATLLLLRSLTTLCQSH